MTSRSDADNIEAAIVAGMTREEADCWLATKDLWNMLNALPKQHQADSDILLSIHRIQDCILARPTYRAYEAKVNQTLK